jgi:hypothetical protein
VLDNLWTEGRDYSVLQNGDITIVVTGKYAIGERRSVAIEGELPVYDAADEWRIDCKEQPCLIKED